MEDNMTRWGMVIDLRKCVSCYACMIACKQEHFVQPGVFFNRLVVVEVGEYPNVKKMTYPILCNHCKKAACVDVCPTGATEQREDGIVVIDPDACIGCRNCEIACPYQQRTFLEDPGREYFPNQGLTETEVIGRMVYTPKQHTVIKCDFCSARIDAGLSAGMKPGIDRDATPACVLTCMVRARHFGDLNDPESNVSVLLRERNGRVLRPELGTEPSVYYID